MAGISLNALKSATLKATTLLCFVLLERHYATRSVVRFRYYPQMFAMSCFNFVLTIITLDGRIVLSVAIKHIQ